MIVRGYRGLAVGQLLEVGRMMKDVVDTECARLLQTSAYVGGGGQEACVVLYEPQSNLMVEEERWIATYRGHVDGGAAKKLCFVL